MLLYLVGYMGSGKSTAGRKLARGLNWDFVDLDKEIERSSGMSINQIFSEKGEPAFRDMETQVLSSLCARDKVVISCGGGTPCYNNNMEYMNENGYTIYLKLSALALKSRLSESLTVRPLIKDLNDIELLEYIETTLTEREHFYKKAKYTTEGLSLDLRQLFDHLESLGLYNP